MIDWLAANVTPLRGLGAASLVMLLVAGCGATVLLLTRKLGPSRRRHPADEALIAVALGVPVVALIPRALVSEGDGSRGFGALAWSLLVAASLPGLLGAARCLRSGRWRGVVSPAAIVLVAALAVPTLASALCAPIGWDELAYHAELPRRWLETGHLGTFLDNPYSAFPGGAEVLATFGTQGGGFTAPRTLTWLAWLLLALAVYRLGRPALRPAQAAALAFAFAWTPAALMVALETYVEPWLALQMAALVLVLRRGVPETGGVASGTSTAIVAGWLSAGAAALKVTGLIVPPLAWLATWPRLRGRARWALPLIAALVGSFGLMAYADAYVTTGTPTFPYYVRLFTPDDPAAVATSELHHDMGKIYGRPGLVGALTAPVEIAWGGGRYSGRLGAQWLPILALALAGCRRRSARRALLAAAAGWVFWTLTTQQSRFLLPSLVLVALAAASGLATLPRRFRGGVAALLVLSAVAGTGRARWMHFWSTAQAAYGIGAAPRLQDYLHTGLGDAHLLACRAVHDLTPEDARVLLLFDSRALYVPREHEVGTPVWQSKWFADPAGRRNPDRVLRELRLGRFTHVLVGAARRDPDAVPELRGPREELNSSLGALEGAGALRPLWEQDGFRLLEIAAREDPGKR